MSDQTICRDQTYTILSVAHDEGNTKLIDEILPHAIDRLKKLEDYEDAIRNIRNHLANDSVPQYNPNTLKVCQIVGVKSIGEILSEAGV